MHKKIVYQKDGIVTLIDDDHEICDTPKRGYYKIKVTNMGMFSRQDIQQDVNVEIPASALEISKEYINIQYLEDYFSEISQGIHKSLGVKNKISYLLHGKQGTGKTTAAYAVIDHFVKKHAAVCITVKNMSEFTFAINFLQEAKRGGDFISAIVFDECEREMYSHESEMKRILDSSDSIDRHMFFFTTNYVDDIPETIKDRPSRIKFPIEFSGIENEEAVYVILNHMNSTLEDNVKLNDVEIKMICPDLKSKTLDEIKNAFIDHVFKMKMLENGLKTLVN